MMVVVVGRIRVNPLYVSIFLFMLLISLASLVARAQAVPLLKGYVAIDSVFGDLDLDGRAELVVAYNTLAQGAQSNDENIPRELRIYKKRGADWETWKVSAQALLGSKEGGMMGDPFGEIKIEKGTLVISHNGGSSWKWSNTDRYRYQHGDFYLIGYSSLYGKPCEYWVEADFNLSTGQIIAKKEYEGCDKSEQEVYKTESETFYKKGIKITLGQRNEREIRMLTPKYKLELYVAVKD